MRRSIILATAVFMVCFMLVGCNIFSNISTDEK